MRSHRKVLSALAAGGTAGLTRERLVQLLLGLGELNLGWHRVELSIVDASGQLHQ